MMKYDQPKAVHASDAIFSDDELARRLCRPLSEEKRHACIQPRYASTGFQMIRSVTIHNFKCYERLEVENCKKINVIVGDSGSGKTALLEAIFLPLCTSPEIALRYRTFRGIDNQFSGSQSSIEDSVFFDLFYRRDPSQPVFIRIRGDEDISRSVSIKKLPQQQNLFSFNGAVGINSLAPITFTWTNHLEQSFQVIPQIMQNGIQLGGTGEDFDRAFIISSNNNIGSSESAGRFSDLSKMNREEEFVELLKGEYKNIKDLSLQISSGATSIYASLVDIEQKIALPNVSGGLNRIVGMLLCMASKPKSVIIADELENGIYYKHHDATWRQIMSFCHRYDSQVFTTTHSKEWLESLVRACEGQINDIALWRLETNEGRPELVQFTGSELQDGIEYGGDVRGGTDLDADDNTSYPL